jgi:organic radical activating enzyme
MKIAKLRDKPEIFYSIQGEGTYGGRPSVFVRTSHCNLHCTWCDTAYTWNWRKFQEREQTIDLTPWEVAQEVMTHSCFNVVFTGGEPLLQMEDLTAVGIILRGYMQYIFDVETNGTILPEQHFDSMIHLYTVSPKLETSGNAARERVNDGVLRFFALNPRAVFKFVITAKEDFAEIRSFLMHYPIAFHRVWLMAEGTTSAELDAKAPWIIDECKLNGFNYSDRIHIRAFGDVRGT